MMFSECLYVKSRLCRFKTAKRGSIRTFIHSSKLYSILEAFILTGISHFHYISNHYSAQPVSKGVQDQFVFIGPRNRKDL